MEANTTQGCPRNTTFSQPANNMSKPQTTTEAKETRQKAFLRRILTKTYGAYKELEGDVELAYERCRGLDY